MLAKIIQVIEVTDYPKASPNEATSAMPEKTYFLADGTKLTPFAMPSPPMGAFLTTDGKIYPQAPQGLALGGTPGDPNKFQS